MLRALVGAEIAARDDSTEQARLKATFPVLKAIEEFDLGGVLDPGADVGVPDIPRVGSRQGERGAILNVVRCHQLRPLRSATLAINAKQPSFPPEIPARKLASLKAIHRPTHELNEMTKLRGPASHTSPPGPGQRPGRPNT